MTPRKPRRQNASGQPTPHAERQARLKQTRVDVYVPPEYADDLDLIVATEAAENGLRPERSRTPAILRAIRERAERVRKKDSRK